MIGLNYDEKTKTPAIYETDKMGNHGYDSEKLWDESDIEKILIKDVVTSIGDRAFDHCPNLTSITFSKIK